jgi:hypothetical protein
VSGATAPRYFGFVVSFGGSGFGAGGGSVRPAAVIAERKGAANT